MISRRVAIVGFGVAHYGAISPEVSYKEMMYEACTKAYEMAGIDPRKDVQSFVSCSEDFNEGTSIFDEYIPDQMGAMLRSTHTIAGDGIHGVCAGVMQILTGRFDVVVVEAHSKASNLSNHIGLIHFAQDPAFMRSLGAHPYVLAGLEMRSFLESTATSEEQCAQVVVKNKNNALFNPMGARSSKVSIEQVLSSPPTFEPLKKLEESQPADAGFCLVLAGEEVVKSLDVEPIWITGIGWCNDSYQPERRNGIGAEYARLSAQMAYKMAGITQPKKAIDVAEIDDSFSYKELQHLEALGLTRKGEAGVLLQEGALNIDGELPTNPSGGSLGCGNFLDANGLFRIIQVAKQLKGEAVGYQVKSAKTGLAMSWRGIPTASGAVCILEV